MPRVVALPEAVPILPIRFEDDGGQKFLVFADGDRMSWSDRHYPVREDQLLMHRLRLGLEVTDRDLRTLHVPVGMEAVFDKRGNVHYQIMTNHDGTSSRIRRPYRMLPHLASDVLLNCRWLGIEPNIRSTKQ